MDLRKPTLGRVSLEISEQYYVVILPPLYFGFPAVKINVD